MFIQKTERVQAALSFKQSQNELEPGRSIRRKPGRAGPGSWHERAKCWLPGSCCAPGCRGTGWALGPSGGRRQSETCWRLLTRRPIVFSICCGGSETRFWPVSLSVAMTPPDRLSRNWTGSVSCRMCSPTGKLDSGRKPSWFSSFVCSFYRRLGCRLSWTPSTLRSCFRRQTLSLRSRHREKMTWIAERYTFRWNLYLQIQNECLWESFWIWVTDPLVANVTCWRGY